MDQIIAALGPFFQNVLKGLEGWALKQIAFLGIAIPAIVAAVYFIRTSFEGITKRKAPQWALVISPLLSGVAFMYSAKIIMGYVGFPIPETNHPQKWILGLGLGMLATGAFKAFKAWRKWRKAKAQK